MKVYPYVAFNGNCEEALRFYEKVFSVTAQIMRYKDAPPDSGYDVPPGLDNHVMHAQFELDGATLMFCDNPPEYPVTVGDNVAISVAFDDVSAAQDAFAKLEEGGRVGMPLQESFWSKCFGTLTDKFGINWQITIVC